MNGVLPGQEPFIDLVQVRTRDSFGSGLLIGPGIVLTALHCVADPKNGWRERADIGLYLWRELVGVGGAPQERQVDAAVAWRGEGANPPDLAVLRTLRDAPEPMREWQRSALPVNDTDARAIGFPDITAGNNVVGGREELNVGGKAIYSGYSNRTVTFNSTSAINSTRTTGWQGLSGGPLVIGDGGIVGVMRNVDDRWDRRSALNAEPINLQLEEAGNYELKRLLSILREPQPQLRPVPANPSDPDFHYLSEYVYMLNRTDEVGAAYAGISRCVGKNPVELLVAGEPADLCLEFYNRLWRQFLSGDDIVPANDRAQTLQGLQSEARKRSPPISAECRRPSIGRAPISSLPPPKGF